MAMLPSGNWLVQKIDSDVVLFHAVTEEEIVRVLFHGGTGDAFAKAQKVIHDSQLDDEDKAFAHFWFGYFYAYSH